LEQVVANPMRHVSQVIVHKTVQRQTVTATAQAVAVNKLAQKAAPATSPVRKVIVNKHVPKVQPVTSPAQAVVVHKHVMPNPQAVNSAALEAVPKNVTVSVHVSLALVANISPVQPSSPLSSITQLPKNTIREDPISNFFDIVLDIFIGHFGRSVD